MNILNSTPSQEIVFGALLLAGTLFIALSINQWSPSKSVMKGGRVRLLSGFLIMTLGVGLILLGLTSGPVPAKEIFALPSNGSLDFYYVDSSIQNSELIESGGAHSVWPGLQSNRSQGDVSFVDAKVKDSSLILDPGFRVSLTNRIMTVAGRIVWLPSFPEFDLLPSLSDERTPDDLGKLNMERLTGVYELAWVSAFESSRNGYN